jgi:rsbT antagonist protein RsbS
VALAMVALGMGTGDVATALDLEEGLSYLDGWLGHARASGGGSRRTRP